MATLHLLLVRWPVQQLQFALGLTGALLLPLLALDLLIMNNGEEWVGREFRSGPVLNVVLATALLFFAFAGGREILQLIGGGK